MFYMPNEANQLRVPQTEEGYMPKEGLTNQLSFSIDSLRVI